MKNILGRIIGFVIGMGGFLFLFKLIFLDHISREDEIAPGAVMIVAIASGLIFAYAGNYVQNYITTKFHQ
ncbi:MAG: hypothetical protein ABI761_18750 [Saprospiraceae bacterium]